MKRNLTRTDIFSSLIVTSVDLENFNAKLQKRNSSPLYTKPFDLRYDSFPQHKVSYLFRRLSLNLVAL